MSRARLRTALALAATASVPGCALVYTDDAGTKHVIGLTAIEIRPSADPRTVAGDVVDVTVVGLGIFATQANAGAVLGYGREISAAVRDHALVLGNPMQAIQPPAAEPGRADDSTAGGIGR
jgi:hypothetical protein